MPFYCQADLNNLNHKVNSIMSNKYIGFQRISLLKAAAFLVSVNNKFYTFIE